MFFFFYFYILISVSLNVILKIPKFHVLTNISVHHIKKFQSLIVGLTCSVSLLTRRILDKFFTRPSMEISTKLHLPEVSTVIHVVTKQIRCVLVNKRLRDISLARLRDLICHAFVVLEPHQVLVWITDRPPRSYNNNTNTQQNKNKSQIFWFFYLSTTEKYKDTTHSRNYKLCEL